jgi:hypothetical protein
MYEKYYSSHFNGVVLLGTRFKNVFKEMSYTCDIYTFTKIAVLNKIIVISKYTSKKITVLILSYVLLQLRIHLASEFMCMDINVYIRLYFP